MNQLRSNLQAFISSLHTYDYILFGAVGAFFLLLLLLAIVLRKNIVTSLFLVLFALIVIVAGPIAGYKYIHATVYKAEISNLLIKKLEFTEALIIKGQLRNVGKQSYSRCIISADAYKGASNFFEELIYPLKPFQKVSILKEEDLNITQSLDFKLIMEPFTYSNEYNLSVKANCL